MQEREEWYVRGCELEKEVIRRHASVVQGMDES